MRLEKSMNLHKNLIGGERVEGDAVPNLNPANTSEVVGYFARGGADDAARAIAAAKSAFLAWSRWRSRRGLAAGALSAQRRDRDGGDRRRLRHRRRRRHQMGDAQSLAADRRNRCFLTAYRLGRRASRDMGSCALFGPGTRLHVRLHRCLARAVGSYPKANTLKAGMRPFEEICADKLIGTNVTGVKAALVLQGLSCGPRRLPSAWPLREGQQQRFAAFMEANGLVETVR
jgi:hypothetical protein